MTSLSEPVSTPRTGRLPPRGRQRGITLFGLMFWGILIGFAGYLVVRVLPTINDGFGGTAPDLGAYELGAAPPGYGPRTGGVGGSAGSGGGGGTSGSGGGPGGAAGNAGSAGSATGGASAGGSGGASGGTGGKAAGSSSDDGGCGCRTAPTQASFGWLALAAFAALARRRTPAG